MYAGFPVLERLQIISADVVSRFVSLPAKPSGPDSSLSSNSSVATPTPAIPLAPVIVDSVAQESSPVPHYTQTPKLTPTPGPTALPTTTPTPMPTSTPLPPPHLRHLGEKQLMLDLINRARERAGLPAVELGDNVAAQLHAEASLAACTSSHWGPDGLKPYMRYSLSGGYQSNAENGHGLDYCITSADNYRALGPMAEEIDEAVAGWLSSPGHRDNILDKWHKKVNIGLAWDLYNFVAYQHFEGDYVEYKTLPNIEDGILSLAGNTRHGVNFRRNRDLTVQVYFDPPPNPLTVGQLSRTYCYDHGRQLAALREPLGGSFWLVHWFTYLYNPCPDPYDVPASASAPRSAREADRLWQEAYRASELTTPQEVAVPWITAQEWTANGNQFSLKADMKHITDKYGDGVYTIIVWAKSGVEDVNISKYAIFYGVEPPDTYSSPLK